MGSITHTTFGQLPAVTLEAPDGARAIITLFGAHVVSWTAANGVEQLFCSSKSALDGSKPIRGGIPIVFPQFNVRGDLVRHGYARINVWTLANSGVENGSAFAEFYLDTAGEFSAQWPHKFELLLRVAIHADELNLSLRVRNRGTSAFSFAAALHSYFSVEDLPSATVEGLHNTSFTELGTPGIQKELLLPCTGPVDRLYHHIHGDLVLTTSSTRRVLHQDGFTDAVVWNPGKDVSAIPDLAEGDSDHYVCIEAALLDKVQLEGGEEWLGQHRIRCT